MASKTNKRAAGIDSSVSDWLLEDSDPGVKLYALTHLLGKSEDGPEAAAARAALMASPLVSGILELEAEGGHWGESSKFYTDKYGGTVWQLLVLAELGADGRDPRIRAAAEFVFEHSQDRGSGGFSVEESARSGGGKPSVVIPCLTGNMVYSLLRLGYGGDERVRRAIDWICEYQRADDGESQPPESWPYERLEPCFGRHSCFMGVVKSLRALAAIPAKKRGSKEKAKIAELAEFILIHRVHKQSHDFTRVSRPGWLRLGFPLMYQTDLLEILCVLADLGLRDERMDEALEVLESKRGADGRWRLENSFNGKMLLDIEKKGEPSKWITARALRVLGN